MTDLVLRLKLTADGSGVVTTVQGAEDAVKRLGDQSRNAASEAARLNDATKRMSAGFSELHSVGSRLRSMLEGLGVAFGLHQILQQADDLKRLSSEFALTTTQIQEFRYIATITGQDVDKLFNSLRKQSTFIMEAAEGNKKAAEAMNKLGLSAKELLKLDMDQQTELIGRAILNLGTATEQTSMATTAWAKSATGMLAIMREHHGSLEQAREDAHRYGQVLSEDAINKLDDLGDSLQIAGRAWLNWASEAGSAIDVVIDALKSLASWAPRLQKMWKEFWIGAEEGQARGFATAIKAQSEAAITELENRQKQFQDKIGQLARTVNEHPLFAPADWQAQMNAYAKQINAIDSMIAARRKEIDVAQASVGAVRQVADAQGKEAEMESRLDSQLRKSALTDINYAKGKNTVTESTRAHASAMSEAEKAAKAFASELDRVLDATMPQQKILGDLNHQMSILDQALAQGAIGWDTYSEAVLNATDIADKALNKDLAKAASEAAKESEKAAKAFETAWEESIKRVDNFFVDLWKGLLSGTSSVIDTIKNLFIQMLAELAHAAITRPIMLQIATSMGMPAAAGTATAGSGILGSMPYGNLLNTGAQLAGINPMDYLSSIGMRGYGWLTGTPMASGAYSTAAETGYFTGGGITAGGGINWAGGASGGIAGGLVTAGAGVLGSLAGGYLSGNPGSTASSIGGIAGTVAGSIIAGPIGALIGSFLGSLIGGLFGGESEPNHFKVSLGTNKTFPPAGRSTIKGYEDYSKVAGPFGDIGFILRGNNDAFDAASEASKKFLEGIAQIDAAFAQFLNPQEVQAVKDRLAGVSEVEFTDSFSAIQALKQRFEEMLDAVDPKLKALYDGFNITADNAGAFAVALLNLRKEMGDLDTIIRALSGQNNPVQQFLGNIDALDAAMMRAATAGQEAIASGDPEKVLQAEQVLRQSIVTRYQYEMDIATQLNSVIESLKASIAQLKEQAYQLAVSQYKDWLDINQRIQATGGGGVAQLDIYRSAGTELLGAYNVTTDPAKRLEMLRQGVEIVDQGLALAMADIDKWAQAERAARQTQIDALGKEKAAIQEAAQTRIDGLNQELQIAQQWAGILSQAQGALDQMKYGGTNPLSSFARLQSVQGDLAGETDPSRRIQLLQTMMGLGGEAYQRPSPEYQRIYNQVVSGLTALRDEAERQAAHAMDLQEEIARASTDGNDKLASIDKQIAALQDMNDIDRRVEEMQREANAEANTYYQWIRGEGAKTYEAMQGSINDQIAKQQAALDIAEGQMKALTAGLGYTAFMAQRQAEMVALLTDICNVLTGLYSGQVTRTQITQIRPEDIRALIPLIRRELLVA